MKKDTKNSVSIAHPLDPFDLPKIGVVEQSSIDKALLLDLESIRGDALAVVTKQFRIGLRIREIRRRLSFDTGKNINGRNQYSESLGFLRKLELLGISKSKAYRHIDSTIPYLRFLFDDPYGSDEDFPFGIVAEGKMWLLSECLAFPEQNLPEKCLLFKMSFLRIVEDEAVRSVASKVASGQSPPIALTRAVNGKIKGGTHEFDNRKNFPYFAARALGKFCSHASHYDKLSETQKTQFRVLIESAFSGNPMTFDRGNGKKVTFSFAPIHEDLCKVAQSASRSRLRKNSYE